MSDGEFDIKRYVKRLSPYFKEVDSLPDDIVQYGATILYSTLHFYVELGLNGEPPESGLVGPKPDELNPEQRERLFAALQDKIVDFERVAYEFGKKLRTVGQPRRVLTDLLGKILEESGKNTEKYLSDIRDPSKNPDAYELLKEDSMLN